jgi:hypothetical protein
MEVLTEDGAPLEQRLGPPQAYAAELRASAGVTTVLRAGPPRRGPLHRLDDELRRTVERWQAAALGHPYGRAVADFLPELRPGWWVLRGVLAVWVLSLLTDGGNLSAFPVPTLGGPRFWAGDERGGRGAQRPDRPGKRAGQVPRPAVDPGGRPCLVVLGLVLASTPRNG